MDASRRASGYDLFKLIVASLLLILFFFLINRPTIPLTAAPTTVQHTETIAATHSVTPETDPVAILSTSTAPVERETSISRPSPTETTTSAPTDSLPSPTATGQTLPTATPSPSPTTTTTETPTATPLPTPTATPVIEATPTSLAEPPTLQTACEAATSRSRLQPGMQATILRRLNFRSSPGIQNNWLRTNIPGTRVKIVGGPECLPHLAGAYVWWQIQPPDGNIGWSAEGSIHGTFYFMEPAK